MSPDTIADKCARRFDHLEAPRNASDVVCTFLKRELRSASADYRMLALHAGSSDHVTIEAKQRIIHLTMLLRTEDSRRRGVALQQHAAADTQGATKEASVMGPPPLG